MRGGGPVRGAVLIDGEVIVIVADGQVLSIRRPRQREDVVVARRSEGQLQHRCGRVDHPKDPHHVILVPDGEGGQLLDWPTAAKIPWGLLILFGGGIAIARAFGESGLSAALGGVLSALTTWPLVLMLLMFQRKSSIFKD